MNEIVGAIIISAALYYIIKYAVINGILEADKIIKEKQKKEEE